MRYLTILKELVVYLGIPVLVFMAIHYNTKLGDVVAGQSSILQAIQKVTTDTNLTAQQQTDTIICMLQVPISQRTTDTKNQCRDNATSATIGSASQTPGSVSNKAQTPASSSSKPTSATPSPQPNNSPTQPSTLQRIGNTLDRVTDKLNPFN
jgi:hypothetical protein